jgi:hypothetical protein
MHGLPVQSGVFCRPYTRHYRDGLVEREGVNWTLALLAILPGTLTVIFFYWLEPSERS